VNGEFFKLFGVVLVSANYKKEGGVGRGRGKRKGPYFEINTYRCCGTFVVELVVAIPYEYCNPARLSVTFLRLQDMETKAYTLIFQNPKVRSLRSLKLVMTRLMPSCYVLCR
jgi:hypothetical protein